MSICVYLNFKHLHLPLLIGKEKKKKQVPDSVELKDKHSCVLYQIHLCLMSIEVKICVYGIVHICDLPTSIVFAPTKVARSHVANSYPLRNLKLLLLAG